VDEIDELESLLGVLSPQLAQLAITLRCQILPAMPTVPGAVGTTLLVRPLPLCDLSVIVSRVTRTVVRNTTVGTQTVVRNTAVLSARPRNVA
jgi:hypothetical protein